jgi:hypothetical protein
LSAFRDKSPDATIPEGIIRYKPKDPVSYGPGIRRDLSGREFAHYSEGMSERPISDYVNSQGNTGFTMQDESGLAVGITDPTNIRSKFARFDPRLKHLANLSAGGAGVAYMSQDDQKAQIRAWLLSDFINNRGLLSVPAAAVGGGGGLLAAQPDDRTEGPRY